MLKKIHHVLVVFVGPDLLKQAILKTIIILPLKVQAIIGFFILINFLYLKQYLYTVAHIFPRSCFHQQYESLVIYLPF